VDRLLEEVGLRDEVRVEERHEVALRGLEAVVQRAGLVAGAVVRWMYSMSTPLARHSSTFLRATSTVSSVESSSTWIWSLSAG
jgi:hypothetical protein